MKTIKVITKATGGAGGLDSPTFYRLPLEEAKEMSKYKGYYHFLKFRSLMDDEAKKRVFEEIKDPDFVLDFREQYKDLDISVTYDPIVLQEYLDSISNEYDNYGIKL